MAGLLIELIESVCAAGRNQDPYYTSLSRFAHVVLLGRGRRRHREREREKGGTKGLRLEIAI